MKVLAATFFATFVALAVTCSATAAAKPPAPDCPKDTVTIGNQGQMVNVPQQSQVCNDDPSGGLLGNLPIVGHLPVLGRIL